MFAGHARMSSPVADGPRTPSAWPRTLAKGAHVQVEGEVRTRQYATAGENGSAEKKTITEIRVRQIAKIDRPAKQLQEGGAA